MIAGGYGVPRCYRLHVMAPTVADAVVYAGGWLFDHALAGWKVAVAVTDCPDPRPLQILGADLVDLDQLESADPEDRLGTLAAGAELYAGDTRAQRLLREAADRYHAEVLLWEPGTNGNQTCSIHYRLGSAARVFKAEALAAAGIPGGTVEPVESFRPVSGQRFNVELDAALASSQG